MRWNDRNCFGDESVFDRRKGFPVASLADVHQYVIPISDVVPEAMQHRGGAAKFFCNQRKRL